MTLMPDVFDDQYIGCPEAMEEAAPRLMEVEMKVHKALREEWNKAKEKWNSVKESVAKDLPKVFKEEYGRAIIAYCSGLLNRELNDAVRQSGSSRATYNSSFHFKAFHYYLTRALQLLRKSCNVTYKTPVYRGIEEVRYQQSGSDIMRFGYFASSSFNKIKAEEFGVDIFFTIHTCFGVDIGKFSYFEEEEVHP
ncbi:ecto-ADP-ribosyltransferase 5-like [Alligator mississippiensis]|uniref:ecto-ADP-ribosyltransferase 5-like n=1 Tax=Alligator mississippiensis TaxID=8496 RepID=UPI002877EA38|nr:ecto-ADP-ribosyltransferase 5-like [Alligator mississippiensis]